MTISAVEVLANLDLRIGRASKSDVLKIYRLADDGGIIQAVDMVRLFAGEPTRHTTCNLRTALQWAGAVDVDA